MYPLSSPTCEVRLIMRWCEIHSETLEAWQLFNDLQALTIRPVFYSSPPLARSPDPPTHASTHLSARCSSQNIPHTSGCRVFPIRSPSLSLPPPSTTITHKSCVLLFSFLFTILSPLPSPNHKIMERTNIIYSYDLEGKRLLAVRRDVPSRNMLFFHVSRLCVARTYESKTNIMNQLTSLNCNFFSR